MAETTDWRRIGARGMAATVLSIMANVILLTIVLQGDLVTPFDPLRYPPVVFLTAVGAIGATAVYGFLAVRRESPDPLFVRVAVVALVLSFVPDVGLLVADPNATVPAVLVLMGMHVVAGAICIGALTDHWR